MIATRLALASERIMQIPEEESVRPLFRNYFKEVSEFILLLLRCKEEVDSGRFESLPEEELKEWNHLLYADILPDHYAESYGNPAYAVRMLGREPGRILSFLYAEIRSGIPYVFEHKDEYLVIQMELFLEIYNFFEMHTDEDEEEQWIRDLKEILFWYASDYCEVFAADRILDRIDPTRSSFTEHIRRWNPADLAYLYLTGEYVGEREVGTARYVNSLPEQEIRRMAEECTQNVRIAPSGAGKRTDGKRNAALIYRLGYERVARMAVTVLEDAGYQPLCFRTSEEVLVKSRRGSSGFHGGIPNPQYIADHREDAGLFLGKRYVDRRLEVISYTYAQNKELAGRYAGMARAGISEEDFPEVPAADEAVRFNGRQEELLDLLAERTKQVTDGLFISET